MKILFTVLMVFHGLIHLMGTVKAFSPEKLPDLQMSISKLNGTTWGLVCLGFIVTAALYYKSVSWWWAPGIVFALLSQILLLQFWQDAKFGMIPNLLILIVCIVAFAGWRFDRSLESDIVRVKTLGEVSHQDAAGSTISEESLSDLPQSVRQWLSASGAMDKPPIQSLILKQSGLMKTSPDQSSWSETEAVQHVNTVNPSFIWTVRMDMMPLVYVRGKDLYEEGEGQMLIKLYSLVDVVNESGEKISRGALQRYLSEMVWYPGAALREYMEWTEIDSTTARASMSWGGLTEEVTFHFAEDGLVQGVSADRFMGGGDDAVRRLWRVDVLESKEMGEYTIPVDVEVSWELEEGTFTWYRFTVTDIDISVKN